MKTITWPTNITWAGGSAPEIVDIHHDHIMLIPGADSEDGEPQWKAVVISKSGDIVPTIR